MSKIVVLSEKPLDDILITIEKKALNVAHDNEIINCPVDFYMGAQYALKEIRDMLNND